MDGSWLQLNCEASQYISCFYDDIDNFRKKCFITLLLDDTCKTLSPPFLAALTMPTKQDLSEMFLTAESTSRSLYETQEKRDEGVEHPRPEDMDQSDNCAGLDKPRTKRRRVNRYKDCSPAELSVGLILSCAHGG